MPHQERNRWCEEISRINEKMNSDGPDDDSMNPTDPDGDPLEPDLAVPRPEDFGLPPDAF